MLSFSQFSVLIEEIASNDDKGKLHELLVAHHLSSDNEEEKNLPSHYRDENGKSPKEVHDSIKSRISEEDYNKAHKRAKKAAAKIKEHLKSKGIHQEHIKKIVWTSNKSDHKKFTGEDDPNSDADVMIETHNHPGHKYHGISLKVGSGNPNLRNPGISQLNSLTKANKDHVNSVLKAHKDTIHKLGYSHINQSVNHNQYKKDKAGENKVKADAADDSKLKTLKHLASHYTDSFNNLSHEDKHHMITKLMAPETKFPHIRVHSKTPKNGGEETHHIEDHQSDLQNELAKHKHGFVAVNKGQRMVIHAKNEDGTPNTTKKIASITMKGVSGPIKGMAAATKQEY